MSISDFTLSGTPRTMNSELLHRKIKRLQGIGFYIVDQSMMKWNDDIHSELNRALLVVPLDRKAIVTHGINNSSLVQTNARGVSSFVCSSSNSEHFFVGVKHSELEISDFPHLVIAFNIHGHQMLNGNLYTSNRSRRSGVAYLKK